MIGIQYSKALFEISVENKSTLEINEQLQLVEELFKSNNDLVKLFTNPAIKKSEKNKIIDNVFAKFNSDLVSFIKVLVTNGRVLNLNEICENYKKLSSDYDKTIFASVSTRKALTMQEQDLLKGKLEKIFSKKVLITEHVDETMIGGFKVTVDGKIIDVSFDSKLEKLKNYL